MSGFPPSKWEVHYLKDMHSLACQANEDGEITMAAYMAVKPSGGEEGTYHFALNGPVKIKLRFAASDLLPGDLFTGMFIEAELAIGDQIQLERNSVCSAWIDLVELVRSQDIMVVDGKDEDVSMDFLAAIDSYKCDQMEETGKADRAGICLRWVLGTRGENTDILLLAQVQYIAITIYIIYSLFNPIEG